jgi:hypothetical protein
VPKKYPAVVLPGRISRHLPLYDGQKVVAGPDATERIGLPLAPGDNLRLKDLLDSECDTGIREGGDFDPKDEVPAGD